MVPDALDLDHPVGFSNNACIIADDATIGPSINEGTTMGSAVLANIICEVGKVGFDFAAQLEVKDRMLRRSPGNVLSPWLVRNARSRLGESFMVPATSLSVISLMGLVLVVVGQKVVCTNIM